MRALLDLRQRGHIQSAEDWEEECIVRPKAEGSYTKWRGLGG